MESNQLSNILGVSGSVTAMQLVEITRSGIPKSVIEKLISCLNISAKELSKYLPVSERTLHRYEPGKQLPKDVSDHVLQIAKLYAKTVDVFEDRENAVTWLKQPCVALGNFAPLELADTYSGLEIVIDELQRIEYGVMA